MECWANIYTVYLLRMFLRVTDPLERLLDSPRCSDLGLLLRDFRGRGFTRPCSSINACCFLRRYSCLISSRRAFSSSLRMRSSSALRLQERKVYVRQAECYYIPAIPRPHNQLVKRKPYLASSRLSSLSASCCCLRSLVSSALRCCLRRKAARRFAISSAAFSSSWMI